MSETESTVSKSIVRLIVIVLLIQLGFIAYVFYQSYEGRVRVVEAQRAGCERGKKDRQANAEGWRIAEAARRADGQTIVANRYRNIALGLEARSLIPCDKAFPDAEILP